MAGMRTDWRGVFAVAATPFTREGEIDEGAFRALMDTLVAFLGGAEEQGTRMWR